MSKEESPNFRHANICRICKYLTYCEENIPSQSRVCTKHGYILSNYTGDFYVCDDFEDVEND